MDTLLPELPVIFENVDEEFRFTFQFAIQERPLRGPLLQSLLQGITADNPLHVYTDGSCQYPALPTLRFAGYSVVLDSCRSDQERIWYAQRFKETGQVPSTFHVVIQELCPQEQQIHHAELLAIIRAQESFSHVIIHSDSASAIATLHAAPMAFPFGIATG